MIDWYPPNSIRFTRDEMIFLLFYLSLLRDGNYPPRGSSGYTEAEHTSQPKSHKAPFETPAQLAAEVDFRLKRTGVDGKALYSEIQDGLDFEDLSYEAQRALNYMSGWRRRRRRTGEEMSYEEWKAHGRK